MRYAGPTGRRGAPDDACPACGGRVRETAPPALLPGSLLRYHGQCQACGLAVVRQARVRPITEPWQPLRQAG